MDDTQLRFSRSTGVWGEAATEKLAGCHAAVFGLGGVGSYAAEALARSGVGELTLIDHDVVTVTNINRQIHAVTATVGKAKTEVMTDRLLGINPELKIHALREFYTPQTADKFFAAHFDYVLDAIDYVPGKISLAAECDKRQMPLISCMGMGNKLDPTQIEVTDIFATQTDPLARVIRKKLRALGLQKLKVVYSPETPHRTDISENGRRVPGSVAFVPSAAGLIMASAVVRDVIRS